MKLQRQYILDVIRSVDAGTPISGVKFALVEISSMKALEIAAMSNLRIVGQSQGRHITHKEGLVFTDDEIVWTDSKYRQLKPGFRCAERIEFSNPGKFRYKSLIQIDKKGGFHFWNLFNGEERVRTRSIPVEDLLAEFRKTEGCDEGLVADGMRRLLKQRELLLFN